MKRSRRITYSIFKHVLGPIFRLYYNPKIIGKENIPKDGPLIFVGNHKHVMDQNAVIMCNKRPVRYMAKKEYFDGHFAWFFRASGLHFISEIAIPDSPSSYQVDILISFDGKMTKKVE